MSAPLTPDHMQEIRERLGSTLAARKSDAEALLAEADRLRAESDQFYSDLTGAYLDRWEEAQDNIRLRQALASAQRGRRELRARVAELETSIAPRLCACGHSRHAHTVPAPHSCFAFGQTCPCPTYRQLPPNEAREQLQKNIAASEARMAESAPQCPEALYTPETDTLRRCIQNGPHDWHETERGVQWRDVMADQNHSRLDDPFSEDPWTDVPTS